MGLQATGTRHLNSPTAKKAGIVGMPASVNELAKKDWDTIIVGGGHNGLTCATYLARAGQKVLVLEARPRIGGACTLEEAWPGTHISPCAYVCGLLHPLVIEELDLVGHGFEWTPAVGGMFVPFDDGSSLQMWEDDAKCDAEIRKFAPKSHKGWLAMCDVKRRLRNALRPDGARDLWIGPAPTREEVEDRLGGDSEAKSLLFDWSMVEFCERYLEDEKLQMAYLGQGVIGTNASPYEPGTASVHFHHASGRQGGMPGTWGYVTGGMGMVSFLLCDIAQEAGVVVATGIPVASITPGESVELESGETLRARNIVSNADPRVALRLLGKNADGNWKKKVESIPIEGCTMKLSVLLNELPSFKARPGTLEAHHYGQVNTPLTKREWQDGFDASRRGELPARLWTELYFHTAFDPSVSKTGKHTMSVFAQYVPHTFRQGSWETRRDEAGKLALSAISRFTSNFPQAIEAYEVMGPPDVEKKVGLTGGHIFQGEILPQYLWNNRLAAKTPMDGFYLCGAATHPGGSVIAINGRNAAMEILKGDK